MLGATAFKQAMTIDDKSNLQLMKNSLSSQNIIIESGSNRAVNYLSMQDLKNKFKHLKNKKNKTFSESIDYIQKQWDDMIDSFIEVCPSIPVDEMIGNVKKIIRQSQIIEQQGKEIKELEKKL
jgi:hypothetical protein